MEIQLKERMQSKKAILAKKEAEEQKANEAIRRKGGKDAVCLFGRFSSVQVNGNADQYLNRPKSRLIWN